MEVTGQLHAPAAFSQGKSPWYPFDEAGWTSEPIWTLWKRDKSLTPAGNRNPIPRQEFNTSTSMVKVSTTIGLVLIRFDRTVCVYKLLLNMCQPGCWLECRSSETCVPRGWTETLLIQLCSCCTFIKESVVRLFLPFFFWGSTLTQSKIMITQKICCNRTQGFFNTSLYFRALKFI
jgi:hypothetical protein